jgi:hypothetical protein
MRNEVLVSLSSQARKEKKFWKVFNSLEFPFQRMAPDPTESKKRIESKDAHANPLKHASRYIVEC